MILDSPASAAGTFRARPGPPHRGTSLATVRTALVHRTLDVPAERLAPKIGSWPGPALLESGRGFGASGRWSILTARPRLVFEASGNSWSIVAGSGRDAETGMGNALGVLARLLRTYGLAGSGEPVDPESPPFQ